MFVRIVSPGPSGMGTRVFNEDGAEIRGISSNTWRAEVDSINTAEVTLSTASTELHGQATFYAQHPITGQLSEIRRIWFEDGSEWSPE